MTLPGFFVTGTDTEVGKTWVTCLIAKQLRELGKTVGVYKPVCSGSETDEHGELFWPDLKALSSATDDQFVLDLICPQRFNAPLAPPVAARLEGREVDAQLMRTACNQWDETKADLLLVEGVGGLLCPLTDTETIADLAGDIGLPLLVVSRAGLGTINHTLLTIEVAKSRNLKVAGVILNQSTAEADLAAETNAKEISQRTSVPVLGSVEFGSTELRTVDGVGKLDWCSLCHL